MSNIMSMLKKSNDTLLVIDGNHLAYRCRFVFSLSLNGVDVSVEYGVLRVLQSLIKKFDARSVVVCWDYGIPNYRRKAMPEYKANRDHGDDELAYQDFVRQVNKLHDYVFPMLGITSVRNRNTEADDLISHTTKICSYKYAVIVSGDKDMLQLVDDFVFVHNPSHDDNPVIDPETMYDVYGIWPEEYLDWRALQGDGSDNIQGIRGVGEKTATKLIKEFGDISTIYNAACGKSPRGTISGKLGKSIQLFTLSKLINNIYVSALYADRTGSRMEIIRSIDNYSKMSPSRAKKYLISMAFSSLVSSGFIGTVSKLKCPELRDDCIRVPVIHERRFPI